LLLSHLTTKMAAETWSSFLVMAAVSVSLASGLDDSYEVLLSSDGPTVLDAPITFFGELKGVDSASNRYRWRWYDTTSPGHFQETESNGTVTSLNYTIVYSSAEYDFGTFEMSLTIYEYEFIYWKIIGEKHLKYTLTRELNGQLVVSQDGEMTEKTVSSLKDTTIDVKFHDPEDFLKDARIHYFWFINTVNYGQTPTGTFEYNFTDPGEYDVEVSVIAYFDNSSRESSPSLLYNTKEEMLAFREERPNNGVKMAIFAKRIVSKTPISNMTVTGETLLKHGEIVDLNIDCTGSAPWLYCIYRKEKGYNITGNETCDSSNPPSLLKTECEFPIIWYFRDSDTYNFLVVITNEVSSHIEVIPVTVYDVASQSPISIVIIPVISSILVVVIIITGVALSAHYRNRLAVEVADFDFGQADEEELQYKSFWERLRESFGAQFTNGGSDSQSEGSSVSGRRSVQMPGPAGIGYGSIT